MRLSFQLILSLLLVCNSILANSSIDSVKNKINLAQDSSKAELYLKLSDQYYSIRTDSAIYFAKEALKWAEKFNNSKLIYDSQVELYYNYILNHRKDLAKQALDYAKEEALNSKDSIRISGIYFRTGSYYSLSSQYDSAIYFFNKSIDLCNIIDDQRNKVNNLIGLGEIYYERGDLELSLNQYLEASKYSKVINNDVKLSLLINMGNIYADEKQVEQAKYNYHKAQEIAVEFNDESTLSVLYNNLAIIYQNEKNLKKALIYFEKSLDIDKKFGDKAGVALCLNNIGENYFKMGETKKAIVCLRESLATNRQLNLPTEIIYNLEVLTQIHLSTKQFTQAYKCLNEGLSLSKKTKTKGKRADLLLLLAKYHNQTGNNSKAFSTMINYNALKDSLHNESRMEKIVELQANFESEKKEKENELLRIKNQFTQEKLEKEEMRSYYLYLLFVLALLVILLIFVLFTSKVKIHNRIKLFSQRLEESNSQLKIMNATKDKFFSIIAHDLRSPFNAILGFSELTKVELKKNKDIDLLKEYNNSLQESAQGLFNLLENLLQWANSQRGELEFSPSQFDINELVQTNLDLFRLKTTDKGIKLSSDIKPGTLAFGDINMVNTIVRNLISNAIKFTDKDGEVFLSAKIENDFVFLSIKDTGIGISQEDQEKLFKLDSNFTTYGTDDEVGSGLGLILCKEFVVKNGGNIWVDSEPKKGSRFTFSLKSA